MLSILVVIGVSYIAGSIPTSIIISKFLKGIDIRQFGSGNAGGTNVFRVLGWKAGVFVMLVDVFKGFAATYWISQLRVDPLIISPDLLRIFAGCSAVIGHIWTVFAGFRGGKGVGTAAGMLIALFPAALWICLAIFIAVFVGTHYVSVSSMIAAVSLPIVLSIFRLLGKEVSLPLYIFSFFAALLIVFTHRSNIKRLLAGSENKIVFKKKKAEI
jgi:acyl phosphate:glycerol-3-phosphate acyltransferase